MSPHAPCTLSCELLSKYCSIRLISAELQRIAADMFQMEAALFVPTGTMSNLIAGELCSCWQSLNAFLRGLNGHNSACMSLCSDGALQGAGWRDDCGRSVAYTHLWTRRECTGKCTSTCTSVQHCLQCIWCVCVCLHSWLESTPPLWPPSLMEHLTWRSLNQRSATVTPTLITLAHGSYVWRTHTTYGEDVCYLWPSCRRCVCVYSCVGGEHQNLHVKAAVMPF